VASVGFGKNLQGVEVDHDHFDLLCDRRRLSPVGFGSQGPPAHICKKITTRVIQSDSDYMSMKLNSVIGSITDFFFSLFSASLVWSELFEANLVGNRGDLAAEEHQRESSTVCVIELLLEAQ